MWIGKFKVSTIIFSTSGITRTSATLTPIEFNHIAKVEVFVSWVLPDKISLPIINIDAFTFAFYPYEIYNLVMEFTKSLIKGKLIKRYKRFLLM